MSYKKNDHMLGYYDNIKLLYMFLNICSESYPEHVDHLWTALLYLTASWD